MDHLEYSNFLTHFRMKKRKIQSRIEVNPPREFVLGDFLKELKGYEELSKKMGIPDENISLESIQKLIQMEKFFRVVVLLERFFDVKVHGKENYTTTFVKEHKRNEACDTLFLLVKGAMEKRNIGELNYTDSCVLELLGFEIPQDVMLIIVSFLVFNFDLLMNLGSVSSDFYLFLLRNWVGTVKISPNISSKLIGKMIYKSMKHLEILTSDWNSRGRLDHISEKNMSYLIDNLHTNTLRTMIIWSKGSKIFYRDSDKRNRMAVFLSLLHHKKVVFPYVTKLVIHKDFQDLNRTDSPSLLGDHFPNLRILELCGKTEKYGSFLQASFEKITTLKELHVDTIGGIISDQNFRCLCQNPEKLEVLQVKLIGEENSFDEDNIRLSTFFEKWKGKLLSLKTLSFKFYNIYHMIYDGTSRDLNFTHEVYNFNFEQNLDIESFPALRNLSLRFFYDFQALSLDIPLDIRFPSNLTSLCLFDPPMFCIHHIEFLKNLENLELVFSGAHPCLNDNSALDSVFRIPYFSKKIIRLDVKLLGQIWRGGWEWVQVKYRKLLGVASFFRLKTENVYGLQGGFVSWEFLAEKFSKHFHLLGGPKNKSRKNSTGCSSLAFCSGSMTKKDWNVVAAKLIPDHINQKWLVVKDDGIRELVVTDDVFLPRNSENIVLKFRRTVFSLKLTFQEMSMSEYFGNWKALGIQGFDNSWKCRFSKVNAYSDERRKM